jgi:hypothetical protein
LPATTVAQSWILAALDIAGVSLILDGTVGCASPRPRTVQYSCTGRRLLTHQGRGSISAESWIITRALGILPIRAPGRLGRVGDPRSGSHRLPPTLCSSFRPEPMGRGPTERECRKPGPGPRQRDIGGGARSRVRPDANKPAQTPRKTGRRFSMKARRPSI